MPRTAFYIAACLLAALIPLLPVYSTNRRETVRTDFPGWPKQFEGKNLHDLSLSAREQRYSGDFPGQIARFTDGEREVIMRWVAEPTRKLHPASDCFQGIGYRIEPMPIHVDESGKLWSCFVASRGDERLLVRERIFNDSDQSWPDVSSWYWSSVSGCSPGPWWAVTVAEKQNKEESH